MPIIFKKMVGALKTPLGLIAIAAVLALTPLTSVVSFLLILFVAARLLPFKSGIVTRLAMGFCLIFCVFGLTAAVAWVGGFVLNSTLVLLLMLAPLALIAFLRRNKPDTNAVFNTNHHELIAAGLAIATVLFIALPVLKVPNGATLLQVVSAGGDNSSHINMVKVSDLNKGLAYGQHNRVNQVPGAVSYPHTWHFNVAFFKWLVEPLPIATQDAAKITLITFYGSALLWFGLLAFFMTLCALRIGALITNKPANSAATSLAIVVCAGVILHWLLQLFTNGFQSQIAALLMIMAQVYLLADAYTQPASNRYPMLLLAGLLAFGASITWTFLMPIAAVILGLCTLQTIVANKKLPSLPVILCFVVLGLFILFQPFLILMFPVSFADGESLVLQRGFINPVYIEALIAVAAIAAIVALLRGRNQPFKVVLASLLLALGFSAALMVYQLSEIGELRYFYYKSLYTAIIFAGALLGAAAYYFANILFTATTKSKTILITCLIVAAGSMIVWNMKDPTALRYIDGSLGGMNTQTAHSILAQLARGPEVSANTTYLGSCNRGDDIRANLITASLTQPLPYSPASFDQGSHDQKAIFEAIATHLRKNNQPIYIISNDQVIAAALKTHLGAEVYNPKLEIIILDRTPETEPITQCPERIRDIQIYPVQ